MSKFSKRETCESVRDLSGQLATLADNVKLRDLAYILRMAELEAANVLTALEKARPVAPEFSDMDRYDDDRHVIETTVATGA